MKVKIVSLVVLFVLIVNFLLFVFVKINYIIFWSVIIMCALFAYKVLPKIRGK